MMQRLQEDGQALAARAGHFDLTDITCVLGSALLKTAPILSKDLIRSDLDDRVRLNLVAKALAEERVVLVLDDFEQNLTQGGDAFLDPNVGDTIRLLAENARCGRLLITSRYPIPGMDPFFCRVPIGPLSLAKSRHLVLRLDALNRLDPEERADVLKILGLVVHYECLAQREPERADYQRDLGVSYINMGNLLCDLGQGEEAREYLMKALAIAEHLAAGEPERADYQRNLAMSLVNVGRENNPVDSGHLHRALAILVSLKDTGRSNPVDEPLIPKIRRILQGLGRT